MVVIGHSSERRERTRASATFGAAVGAVAGIKRVPMMAVRMRNDNHIM